MGREVRRVPKDWQHPKKQRFDYRKGCYVEEHQPMHDRSFSDAMHEWYAGWEAWERGERPKVATSETYWQWAGNPPDPDYFMPQWPDSERTHLMMYENTTEGTPISPAFETPEELARWLTDNEASAFGDMTGTYEGWLRVAQGGFAPSVIISNDHMQSGVDGLLSADYHRSTK